MPDNSFGFTMDISEKGLDAYNNKITLYNSLLLDSTGLYVEGNIKYNTTSLFSDKIRLFPDSISSVVEKGFMLSGNIKKNSFMYPDIEFTNLDFRFFNEQEDFAFFKYDSILDPNILGYGGEVEIIGDIYVSSDKVTSYGKIETNNSSFISDNFSYNQNLIVSENTSLKLSTSSIITDLFRLLLIAE